MRIVLSTNNFDRQIIEIQYLNSQIGPTTLKIFGYKTAFIMKISVLSGSIILHFLSELEGPSLPMKLIVVP